MLPIDVPKLLRETRIVRIAKAPDGAGQLEEWRDGAWHALPDGIIDGVDVILAPPAPPSLLRQAGLIQDEQTELLGSGSVCA